MNKKNEKLVTLNQKNISDILKIQSDIISKLPNVFKWNELFFANTKNEFSEFLKNQLNYGKWIYNDQELIAYWIIVKDVWFYKEHMLDEIEEHNSAQIDIIAVNPNYQWQWYWGKLLTLIEWEYLKKYNNIKTFLATVSPYNKASLRMFLSKGYYINWMFKKHNKYYRVIVRKDLHLK